MFDIGFSELVLIGVVALIVIGPERLPKAARTMGHLFGRLQRYVNEVKSDINREMELDELRKLQQQVQTAAQEFETSVSSAAREVETSVSGAARSVESDLRGSVDTSPVQAAADLPPLAEPPADAPAGSPGPPMAAPEPAPARQAALPGFEKI
jgi:sec-independent protein translocase protein TatB